MSISTPNPGEVEKISSAPQKDNPAKYGYETRSGNVRVGYENEKPVELKPVPVVTIGPNVAYIVDTGAAAAIKEKIGGGTEPADEVPTLTAIEPNELPVWAQDTVVTFVGTGFTSVTEIIWNGSGEPTTLVDSEHVTTIVKPSTVEAPLPFTLQAWVANGSLESERLDFTFIQ